MLLLLYIVHHFYPSIFVDLFCPCTFYFTFCRDNGFSCKWNSEYFEFSVNFASVAMLEFIVMDSDAGFLDDTMCKAAVPVSCLRQGIRSVVFHDYSSRQHGPFEMARVLVDVDIKN